MNNLISEMLPMKKDLNAESYVNELAEAYGALKEYQTVYNYNKLDKEILTHLMVVKEAVNSVNIESYKANLDDYFELNIEKNRNSNYINEIENYIENLENVKTSLKNESLAVGWLKKIHKEITEKELAGGKLRSSAIEPLLEELLEYIKKEEKLHVLIKAAIIYAQYEYIHPFENGNGKMARLLLPNIVNMKDGIEKPSLYLSEFIEKHRFLHYKHLNEAKNNLDWMPWIRYFLNMIEKQSTASKKMIEELEELYIRDFNKVEAILFKKYINNIYKEMFKNPVFSINFLANATGYNYQTIRKHLVILEDDGIVSYRENSKGRIYYYDDLIKVLKKY
jgi:Fic family protein